MGAAIEVPQIEVEELPKEVGACHAMIVELLQIVSRDKFFIEKLQQQLERLIKHRFGQRSDRVNEAQLMLFLQELTKAQGEATAEEKVGIEEKKTEKPRGNGKKRGRKPLSPDLPREVVLHDVPESEKTCGKCETAKVVIRQETTEQLEYVPPSVKVLQHVQPVYACPKGCEGQVVMASKPMQPIEKGLPGPGLMAYVVTSKYADHLPLNRQEGILERYGIEITKQTMWGWVSAAADIVTPLYDLMRTEVLASRVIQTDDTPVKLQGQPEKSRMWVYIGDERHPYLVYDHTESRRRDGPVRFLGRYQGKLQADAYGGYDGIYAGKGVTEVACWAHARRKYTESESSDPLRSIQTVAWIKLLYEVEGEAKEFRARLPVEMDDMAKHERFVERRLELRQEKSKPLMEKFEAWLREQMVLPKSPIGEAIGYTLNNMQALKRYLDDGELEMDNNAAERALRHIAVGRNNWLWVGSLRGGKAAAIFLSLVQTCKRHDIDPFEYLRDLFARLSAHPVSRLAEFLPDQWKALRDQARDALATIPTP